MKLGSAHSTNKKDLLNQHKKPTLNAMYVQAKSQKKSRKYYSNSLSY